MSFLKAALALVSTRVFWLRGASAFSLMMPGSIAKKQYCELFIRPTSQADCLSVWKSSFDQL